MSHDLESVPSVERDGWAVVLLDGEDYVARLGQRALEQLAGIASPASSLDDTETGDIQQAVVVSDEDISEKLTIDFYDPPLPPMELVLEHALRHGVGEQVFLEREESRYIQSARSSEHDSEHTRETQQ